MAALCTARCEYAASVLGGHPRAESVFVRTLAAAGLVCTLHCWLILSKFRRRKRQTGAKWFGQTLKIRVPVLAFNRSMKLKSIPKACILIPFVLLVALLWTIVKPNQTKGSDIGPRKGFAVIELFTSEGCSSCPPADALIGDYVTKADAQQLAIYPLSFHVDYWNSLGWEDPFSSAENTYRQTAYGTTFKLSSVYTPEAVVNGASEFVGSDRDKLETSVNAALEEKTGFALTVNRPSMSGTTLQATVITSAASGNDTLEGMMLNIALVERTVESQVKRGENSGRTLKHWNVVRRFKQVSATEMRSVTFDIPEDMRSRPESIAVIAYLQDRSSMHILAAAEAN